MRVTSRWSGATVTVAWEPEDRDPLTYGAATLHPGAALSGNWPGAAEVDRLLRSDQARRTLPLYRRVLSGLRRRLRA